MFSISENGYTQKISNITDAENAIKAITEQGEGLASSPAPTPPFKESDFPIPSDFQSGIGMGGTDYDSSHFGRFLKIKNKEMPDCYIGTTSPSHSSNVTLQSTFSTLIQDLNTLWKTGTGSIFSMSNLLPEAEACWKAGVVPNWSGLNLVKANQAWQDTGFTLAAEKTVTISYKVGQWTADPSTNNGNLYGANGNPNIKVTQSGYPIQNVNMGALIGRVGTNPPFLIGDGPVVTPVNQVGALQLCINDDLNGEYGAGLSDNIGSLLVKITS